MNVEHIGFLCLNLQSHAFLAVFPSILSLLPKFLDSSIPIRTNSMKRPIPKLRGNRSPQECPKVNSVSQMVCIVLLASSKILLILSIHTTHNIVNAAQLRITIPLFHPQKQLMNGEAPHHSCASSLFIKNYYALRTEKSYKLYGTLVQ